jgi:uncharacterized caspase-like protein
MDALNRVKEQIVPGLLSSSDGGRERLTVMASTLEKASHVCRDSPELWYYRMVIAERLGLKQDFNYAKKRVEELNFEIRYNPFTAPDSAIESIDFPSARIGEKWALVVGIDTFEDKRAPALSFAVKDSRDFVGYLEGHNGGQFKPDHVLHLENGDATLRGIREGLGRLRESAQRDDLIVIYIASHGSPRERDPNGVSYVVTHDTNLQDSATLYASSLQMIDLVQTINREFKARRVVLILDTCYSGGALESAGSSGKRGLEVVLPDSLSPDAPASASFSEAFKNLIVGKGRAVITASRADEVSWESPALQNGYFTHYLIEVLGSAPRNARLRDVFAQVRTTVSTQVRLDHHASQTPSFDFGEQADAITFGEAVAQ